MRSLKQLARILILKEKTWLPAKISPIFLLMLFACSQEVVPTAPVEVKPTATEVPATQTLVPTVEVTAPPTSAPEEALLYPYYLSLATKPEKASQTINSVTAQIDWAYVDESRVSIHYTISGLDWPDGTTWDAMLARISSPAIPDTAYSGAGGWGSMPAEHGVITGTIDQFFWDGAFDAGKYPDINLNIVLPVDGPTPVGTFHLALHVPVLEGIKLENLDQTVVANNISMTLKSLTLNPSHAEAVICFQMPSEVDWGLTASKLTVGGREYPFVGGGLIAGPGGKGFSMTDPERCNSIGFDIRYDPSASAVTLRVPKLLGSIPEVITAERVEIANQRLAERGIQFDYVNVDHGGNIEILQQPANMNDFEIYPLIWDALAEQYEGPWVFTVPIKR